MGIPTTDLSTVQGSGYSFVPTPNLPVLDRKINPITLDYIRTSDGEWEEVSGAQTAMMIMLEVELGTSPFDPNDGTAIKALMRSGDLVTVEILQSETLRVGRLLAADGMIANQTVRVRDEQGLPLVDENGTAVVENNWTDLATGTQINQTFQAG